MAGCAWRWLIWAAFYRAREAVLRIGIHARGADGSDASWLRGQYQRQGSAEGMVNAAIERFRGARLPD